MISNLRAGKRELSPELAALIADVAGLDPQQAVLDAVIERNKTGPKAEQIRQILGKAAAAGVAAMLLVSYNAGSLDAMEIDAAQLTPVYIVLCGVAGWVVGWLAVATGAGLAARVPMAPGMAATVTASTFLKSMFVRTRFAVSA